MHFLFEKRKPDKQLAAVEKVLSLLLFVEFEIIGSSACWMRAENTLIQTAGYAFRKTAGEILGDFGAEFSKTKTLGAGVRIFNGAVRTEREFPLKILFLACIQGLVFYLFCGTEIKISPAALRIRFLFTLYQSIFEPLFSHMLQINSNSVFPSIDHGSASCQYKKGNYSCCRCRKYACLISGLCCCCYILAI